MTQLDLLAVTISAAYLLTATATFCRLDQTLHFNDYFTRSSYGCLQHFDIGNAQRYFQFGCHFFSPILVLASYFTSFFFQSIPPGFLLNQHFPFIFRQNNQQPPARIVFELARPGDEDQGRQYGRFENKLHYYLRPSRRSGWDRNLRLENKFCNQKAA